MTDLIARDRRAVWHPYTHHGVEVDPLPVVRADGAWLELADGRRILDGISSWWATLHGHGHPRLVAALHAQAATLDHVLFAGATREPAVRLAERLLAVAPEGLSRVFYSDAGSTAVEVALKLVLQAWVHRGAAQRRVFVALEGAYHGGEGGRREHLRHDSTGSLDGRDARPGEQWHQLRRGYTVTANPTRGRVASPCAPTRDTPLRSAQRADRILRRSRH